MQKPKAVKKGCGPKMLGWKKMWNQRWWPRNGCDNSSMAKILITTIQVNLCIFQVSLGLDTKFTWIVIIKSFSIELLSQPFLGHHLWFHIFFHPGILGPHPFFTACYFCIDITSFLNCIFIIDQAGHKPVLVFFIYLFLYYRSNALLWKRYCIQNLTVLVSFYI